MNWREARMQTLADLLRRYVSVCDHSVVTSSKCPLCIQAAKALAEPSRTVIRSAHWRLQRIAEREALLQFYMDSHDHDRRAPIRACPCRLCAETNQRLLEDPVDAGARPPDDRINGFA